MSKETISAALLALFNANATTPIGATGEDAFCDIIAEIVDAAAPADGVYAYITTPATTTCTVADTYYFLEGTFDNEVLECWAIVPPITYLGFNGTDGHAFQITVCATIYSNTNNDTVRIALYKNEVLQSNSIMSVFLKTAGDPECVSTTDVLTFAIGDEVTIRVSSDKAGSQVVAQNLTAALKRFF